MNPSITFKGIVEELKPVSIILTSGTLSPMDSYEAELKLSFPIKISCEHVINPNEQVLARVVKSSHTEKVFDFSYASRDDKNLILDLGKCLINAFESTPCGTLVFFTSYGVMANITDVWKAAPYDNSRTYWQRMAAVKMICVEHRDKNQYESEMRKFMDTYESGATFFAVCGGKVSEGIDFTDDMARLVAVVGIPFAFKGEGKIPAKMDYLDKKMAEVKDESVKISGKRWYEIKAMRLLSQSIGRVIRHKGDYGAIMLFDHRMARSTNLNQLSNWVQKVIKIEDSFSTLVEPLRIFFENKDDLDKKLTLEVHQPPELAQTYEPNQLSELNLIQLGFIMFNEKPDDPIVAKEDQEKMEEVKNVNDNDSSDIETEEDDPLKFKRPALTNSNSKSKIMSINFLNATKPAKRSYSKKKPEAAPESPKTSKEQASNSKKEPNSKQQSKDATPSNVKSPSATNRNKN